MQASPFLDSAQWQQHLFRGQWVAAAQGATVLEPATGRPLTQVGLASPDDVSASVPPEVTITSVIGSSASLCQRP